MAEDVYQRNLTEFYYDSARNVHFLYRPYENAVPAAVQVCEWLQPEYPAVRCGVFWLLFSQVYAFIAQSV